MAFIDIQLILPTVHDLADCKSAKEVASIPAPEEEGLVGFEGSAIFIPGPILSNTIIKLNSKKPFELIPIISNTVRIFNGENESRTKAVNHEDDLSAWLYGVQTRQDWSRKQDIQLIPTTLRSQISAKTGTCNVSQVQWH